MPRPRTILAITIAVAALAVTAAIIIVIPRDPPLPPQVLPWEWDDVVSVTVRPARPDPGLQPYEVTDPEDLMDFRRAVEAATLTVTPNPEQRPLESMERLIVVLRDRTFLRFRSPTNDHWLALAGERGAAVDVELRGASLAAFLDERRDRAIVSSDGKN